MAADWLNRAGSAAAGLTWQGEQGLEVSTLGDAGAVFGAGVPQVLKLPQRHDDAAGHGGDLPVVVDQRRSGDQPADDAHDEPGGFQSCRHGGGVSRDADGRTVGASDELWSSSSRRTLTCRGAINEPLPVAPYMVGMAAATPTHIMFN